MTVQPIKTFRPSPQDAEGWTGWKAYFDKKMQDKAKADTSGLPSPVLNSPSVKSEGL